MILPALTEAMHARPKLLLGLVTTVYVISFAPPAWPPSQEELDLSPDPSGLSGLEVVVWLTRLLLAGDFEARGALIFGGILLANLGIVAAWVSVTGLVLKRIAPWVAAGCAMIAPCPGIVSAWAEPAGPDDRLEVGYYVWVGALIAAAVLSAVSRYDRSDIQETL
jgi:fatty acid desaturase